MTEVVPDPKPEGPVKDPALLRDIHKAWQAYGCSICGQTADEDAHVGAQIEVHHIVGRAHGDDSWENTLGLCGAFLPCRCHQRVTDNELDISFVVGVGYVWTDKNTYEEGVCRTLGGSELDIALGPVPPAPARLKEPFAVVPDVPDELLPPIGLVAGIEGVRGRFETCQALWQHSQLELLQLAVLLLRVRKNRDYEGLGFKNMTEYLENVGIPSPTASKMKIAAETFATYWSELSDADRRELTVDRLYYAAQLLKRKFYKTTEEALGAAISTPQRYLWEQNMFGKTFVDKPSHKCSECGYSHPDLRAGEAS